MLGKFLIPIVVIIISIWNIVYPMKCNGPIVVKLAKKANNWNVSQRVYSIQALLLNSIFLMLAFLFPNDEVLSTPFYVFIIIILIELLPVLTTYIFIKVKQRKD